MLDRPPIIISRDTAVDEGPVVFFVRLALMQIAQNWHTHSLLSEAAFAPNPEVQWNPARSHSVWHQVEPMLFFRIHVRKLENAVWRPQHNVPRGWTHALWRKCCSSAFGVNAALWVQGSRNTFYPLVDLTGEGDGLLIAWSLEVVWLVRSSNPPSALYRSHLSQRKSFFLSYLRLLRSHLAGADAYQQVPCPDKHSAQPPPPRVRTGQTFHFLSRES